MTQIAIITTSKIDKEDKTLFPVVSVIVPVYNGRFTIKLCLDALLQLDYPKEKLEIIIVDNNSSDGTPEVIYNYPFRLIFERSIQSSYAARNYGAKNAWGEILLFTDADCVPEPDWARNLVQPFSDSHVAAAAGRIISEKGDTLVEQFTAEANPLGMHTLGGMLSLVTANVAYRRSAFEQMGGFNQRMTTGADVALGWRVQQMGGMRVAFVEDAVIRHKHRTTFKGLRRQYHRYGFSEIILDTIFKDQGYYPRKPTQQIGIMLRQFFSLWVYVASMIYRRIRVVFEKRDEKYLAWPRLWFIAESSNLAGKLSAIWQTRFFTHDLYNNQ